MPDTIIFRPIFVAVGFGATYLIAIYVSRLQRKEAGVSVLRQCLTIAVLHVIAWSPALQPLFLGEKLDLSWAEIESYRVVDGPPLALANAERLTDFVDVGWGGLLPVNGLICFLAVLYCGRLVSGSIRSLGQILRKGRVLPPLKDEAILERISSLSRQMGVSTPRVLVDADVDGGQEMQAIFAGMMTPIMVVSDGLLGRLGNEDSDAILAHELAHHARWSIWKTFALLVAVAHLAVFTSSFLFPTISAALLIALMYSVTKVWSHHDELATDLRAARVVGFANMASGLARIGRSEEHLMSGRTLRWVHATQTHPGLELRLGSLAKRAPPEEREAIEHDAVEARKQRSTNRTVFVLWLGILVFAVYAGTRVELKWYGLAALAVVVVLPPLLVLHATLKKLLLAVRLASVSVPWRFLARWTLCVVAIYLSFAAFDINILIHVAMAAGIVFLCRLDTRYQRRTGAAIDEAIADHDFDRGIQICEKIPQSLALRMEKAFWLAGLHELAGNSDTAISILEDLVESPRRDRPARFRLAHILRLRDPEKALELVNQAAHGLRPNYYILGLRAGLNRRLGNLEAARQEAEQALELEPKIGGLHALLARIEIDAGEYRRAEEQLTLAERYEPGSALLLLVQAELALARDTREMAETAVARACEAIDKQPLLRLADDACALRERLNEQHSQCCEADATGQTSAID